MSENKTKMYFFSVNSCMTSSNNSKYKVFFANSEIEHSQAEDKTERALQSLSYCVPPFSVKIWYWHLCSAERRLSWWKLSSAFLVRDRQKELAESKKPVLKTLLCRKNCLQACEWFLPAPPAHTPCLASLRHRVLGQGHCWAPSTLMTASPHALRKEPRNCHDVATEKIVPHCLDSVGIRDRHRYLWYLKRKLSLPLIIIYLIRFKKCIRSHFHSCCWFVSTSVPRSPCCFLYGLQSYFPLFKEMFFSPLLLHETATWTTVQQGGCPYPQPCQGCKSKQAQEEQSSLPELPLQLCSLTLAMA